MLRTYLTKEIRLHVWDSRYAVKDVSLLHDHPWDFTSVVVSGQLMNARYVEDPRGDQYEYGTIQCGPGGGRRSDTKKITLRGVLPDVVLSGEAYTQKADEIHRTYFLDGTVTLVERTFRPDTEHARVFWPVGLEWVSAEPRPATPGEVAEITRTALFKLDR